MKTTITVVEPHGNAMYARYAGQAAPQPSQIELDLRAATLAAGYNPHIGGGCDHDTWHGHTQVFRAPRLTDVEARHLLEALLPLANRVAAGYESVWDGRNHVASFTPDARAALAEMSELCAEWDGETIEDWSAADWYEGADWTARGLTADSTDDQLAAIAEAADAEAPSNIIIHDTLDHLRRVREQSKTIRTTTAPYGG